MKLVQKIRKKIAKLELKPEELGIATSWVRLQFWTLVSIVNKPTYLTRWINNMPVFENFKLLKKDMEENGWVIEAFPFNYKNNNFIVLVKLYLKGEARPKYALLKTEIIKKSNINESIMYPVNSSGFMDINVKEFREFFNVEYSEQLGDILQQFYAYFSKFIPDQINLNKSETIKSVMVSSLSKSDSEDPDKVYCYTVTRKGNRSPYNDNKTRLLRPNLYLKFKEDTTISFCYKNDIIEEKSDEEILLNFAKRIEKESTYTGRNIDFWS